MMVHWNRDVIMSTFIHIKFFNLDYFVFQYFSPHLPPLRIQIYTQTHTYKYIHTHTYTRMQIYSHTYKYIHTHTNSKIFTHTHTHTHTQIHSPPHTHTYKYILNVYELLMTSLYVTASSWQAYLVNILRSQGAFPPGFYLLREGWVHRPAPEAPLIRGMPTGPRAFLEPAGCVWATALHPDPP